MSDIGNLRLDVTHQTEVGNGRNGRSYCNSDDSPSPSPTNSPTKVRRLEQNMLSPTKVKYPSYLGEVNMAYNTTSVFHERTHALSDSVSPITSPSESTRGRKDDDMISKSWNVAGSNVPFMPSQTSAVPGSSVQSLTSKSLEEESNDRAVTEDEYQLSDYPIEVHETQAHGIYRRITTLQQTDIEEDTEEEAETPGDVVDRPLHHSHQYLPLLDAERCLKNLKHRIQFQRIVISGVAMGVTPPELLDASSRLISALQMREFYMARSLQPFCKTTSQFLETTAKNTECLDVAAMIKQSEMKNQKDAAPEEIMYYELGEQPSMAFEEDQPFNVPFPEKLSYKLRFNEGVMQVFADDEHLEQGEPLPFPYMKIESFVNDFQKIARSVANGPLKSFCWRRLSVLESKFKLHCYLNELLEATEQKRVRHRDFYNIRKVDTHIHAASCMNQKHLLRFIKKKYKVGGDDVVTEKDGKKMTLKQVFDTMNLRPYDLSVDSLDMHADRNTFHRFDKFNTKYNPIGSNILREVFLKTDNYINGKYFAEIIREVMDDLSDSKYQHAEPRLSIYGRKAQEWDNLAKWAVENGMYSANIRWMIQVPRLFDVYHANGNIDNFQQFIDNVFAPLFEATIDPNSHPDLFRFMHHISGFDSVDDESKHEDRAFDHKACIPPEEWNFQENPPYAYYLFYMYANIAVLNHLRQSRCLNVYTLRPHCGEAGLPSHLIVGFLLSDNINHGLLLRKASVLQYLFYLSQIGVAMSPLSNNSLFLNYDRNPLHSYLAHGLNVSLSTDDPLQFHFTKEPLMEEYSMAAQVWKLTSCDMCELARNSVLMSGFNHEVKSSWLGKSYVREGCSGNDIERTNVPSVRLAYRYETLLEELHRLSHAIVHQNETQ